MITEHIQTSNSDTEHQVRSLLAERQRELLSLELNHLRMPWRDFLSCRRSLHQAINELKGVLQSHSDLPAEDSAHGEEL